MLAAAYWNWLSRVAIIEWQYFEPVLPIVVSADKSAFILSSREVRFASRAHCATEPGQAAFGIATNIFPTVSCLNSREIPLLLVENKPLYCLRGETVVVIGHGHIHLPSMLETVVRAAWRILNSTAVINTLLSTTRRTINPGVSTTIDATRFETKVFTPSRFTPPDST